MPKPRTKRGVARDEKKQLKRRRETVEHFEETDPKRARRMEQEDEVAELAVQQDGPGEIEFFGMLEDQDQELFRNLDNDLERDDFAADEERQAFMEKVFSLAEGKELKLASSQSCSRLMEKLIQRSNTAQKKQLFEAFGSHFLSLVQHRFASHCCEALFLQSAPVITYELAGFESFVVDTSGGSVEDEKAPHSSMEDLFLATLDELEGSLSYLITDKFASHTLRTLMLVLSGRGIDDPAFRGLMNTKKKENVSTVTNDGEDTPGTSLRAVPSSFTMAVKKILQDSTAGIDATGLRVLARHPIGNPTLQLLLALDMSLNKSEPKDDSESTTLLQKLLPGVPKSLSDETSEASQFVNGMIYDQIGSRVIELLISDAPGKVFKALNQNILLPRIHGYARNDIASYAAIRALNRMGGEDLQSAVERIGPSVPQLVSKGRYNVIRTLFERCAVRGLDAEIKQLMRGLREGCGSEPGALVTKLCCLGDVKPNTIEAATRNEYALQSHGAQLLVSLLSIPGPTKGVHEALLTLNPEQLVSLAKASNTTSRLICKALETPSTNGVFCKTLIHEIIPHTIDLALSTHGHNIISAIVNLPSKGKEGSVPVHMKETVMNTLAWNEAALRESWAGRSVWKTWKGDLWNRKRGEWKIWVKGMDTPM